MCKLTNTDLSNIRRRKASLHAAIERHRSEKWILRLWCLFIKERDSYRCVCCGSEWEIQAHHIIRRTLYPLGETETGNGITLCRECHRQVHETANGVADLSSPLSEADDQEDWATLFGLLLDDAQRRGLNQDEFYYLGDRTLKFFVDVQGYRALYEDVIRGDITRVRFAHEIWSAAPESSSRNFLFEVIRLNL